VPVGTGVAEPEAGRSAVAEVVAGADVVEGAELSVLLADERAAEVPVGVSVVDGASVRAVMSLPSRDEPGRSGRRAAGRSARGYAGA